MRNTSYLHSTAQHFWHFSYTHYTSLYTSSILELRRVSENIEEITSMVGSGAQMCSRSQMFATTDVRICSDLLGWSFDLKPRYACEERLRIRWQGMFATLNMALSQQFGNSSSATCLREMCTSACDALRPMGGYPGTPSCILVSLQYLRCKSKFQVSMIKL